jgi:hypothetical protein
MGTPLGGLRRRLANAPSAVLTGYAVAAAFSAYFCMYAFRKPFAVASFEGRHFLGGEVGLKTALVVSQVLGYTLSKYLGIKVCAEATAARRAALLVGLVLAAEAALLLFAVVPDDFKVVALFLNGLPLGMVWGLVVGYLEGRRTSELLLAGLSCSFIVASGAVKDVGRHLMSAHAVSEAWMPFATGLLFLPPFLLSVGLLHQIPPPDEGDVAARARRTPMDGGERSAFVRELFAGLALLFVVVFFLLAYRDFRDNYGVEVFRELGYDGEPALFTRSELLVAFGVLAALAALNLVADNRLALLAAHALMAGGLALVGVATLLLDAGRLSGFWWMVLVGLGAYAAYVPYGAVLFDRMIASTRVAGNAVFAIYVADALGYTGSVGVLLYKDLAHAGVSRVAFLRGFSYLLAAGGTVLLIGSAAYFFRRHRPAQEPSS